MSLMRVFAILAPLFMVGQLGPLPWAAMARDLQEVPRLPIIWGHSRPTGNVFGSFRILSEIRLADNEGSFVAEEWSAGDKQLYRLDVVSMDTYRQESKQTILIDGARNERHFFQPFKCRKLVHGTNAGPLYKLFPDAHPFVVSGLGAIWLYALNSKRAVYKEPAGLNLSQSAQTKRRPTIGQVLSGYDKFSVEPDETFPYKVELYFSSNGWRKEDGGIEASTLVAIHLVELKTLKIKLSAKVIEIDTLNQASVQISKRADLFELPLGYGCARNSSKTDVTEEEPESFQRLVDCFEPRDGQPHVCSVQAVASVPTNANEDLDKWKVHTSSLKFVSGTLANRSYVVQERRDFAPVDNGNPASVGRKSIVRLMRRVWELGDEARGELEGEKSLYFELGDHLRSCKTVDSARLNEVSAIEAPLIVSASERGERRAADQQRPASDRSVGSTRIGGLSLDPKMMHELFISNEGFGTVRENLAKWQRLRDFIQEKRVEHFLLRGTSRGEIIWSGPASIVRKFFLIDSTLGKARTHDEIHLDIYLFTSQEDEMLARIHLRLAHDRQIDVPNLHRALDITPCLLAYNQPAGQWTEKLANQLPLDTDLVRARARSGLSFALVYPLELDEETLELVMQTEGVIYTQLLENLVKLSGNKLDPLQVNELRVDLDADAIRVSGTLSKWPELFSFKKIAGVRFNDGTRRKFVLTSELKPSESECAESCQHLGCSSFVYCSKSSSCELASDQQNGPTNNATGLSELVLELDVRCNLWSRRSPKNQQLDRVAPGQLFSEMRRDISASDDDQRNPLTIRLELADNRSLLLVPDDINLDHDNDPLLKENLLRVDGKRPAGMQESDQLEQSVDSVRVEFEILFQERKFTRATGDQQAFPIEEATHMDYADCERLCLENDCKSFSHCRMSGTCLVSQLNQNKAIEANSAKADFCLLMARIQLSKFHRIANMMAPSDESTSAGQQQTSVIRRQHSGSSRDCAIACLDDDGDEYLACKSFYFCKNSAYDCVLMSDRRGQVNELANLERANLPSEVACDLYRRSYVADYNGIAAKQFDPELVGQVESVTMSLLLGLDADACAGECTHSRLDCLAFHVCLNSDFERGKHQIVCAILSTREQTKAGNREKLRRWDLASGKLLKSSQTCTTFVSKVERAQWSEPQPQRQRQAAKSHGAEEERDSPASCNGASLMSDIMLVMFGLVAGYGLAWLLVIGRDLKVWSGRPTRLWRNWVA